MNTFCQLKGFLCRIDFQLTQYKYRLQVALRVQLFVKQVTDTV